MADADKPPTRHNAEGTPILLYGIANDWLRRWFDAHMATVAGAPVPPEIPRCPGCDGPAHSVSMGREFRGWFSVWPCRCGFEVEPIPPPPLTATTTYLPMNECEPEPTLSPKAAAEVMRVAYEAGVQPERLD